MIHTNSNPKMTQHEVKEFRARLRKCVSMGFTTEQKKEIMIRAKRIDTVGKRITSNKGGKNPILGY